MERQPNTQYVLSLSYGKDSLACLEAIRILGYPLDRIVHAEVWATDEISADLPPMVDFKSKADKIILERYGIEVEHICAMKNGEKLTYEKMFYTVPKRRNHQELSGGGNGFPMRKGSWCTSRLKSGTILDSIRIPKTENAVLPIKTQRKCPRQEYTDSATKRQSEAGGVTNSKTMPFGKSRSLFILPR